MKIIVDAMGGDHAPLEIVKGALDAQKEFDISIVLVGQKDEIQTALGRLEAPQDAVEIVAASQVITMEDDPSTAVRKKPDSSMAVGLKLLAQGGGDAFVSAGNTGALLTGATLLVKRVKGILRAAMAPVLPDKGKGAVLIDCGANAECTPEYLLQFAFMGSYYAKHVLHIEKPRVGLVNIGTEETKGTTLQRDTFALLQRAHAAGKIEFVGNIESRDVLEDQVDVLVADGFTGNIILKTVEGTAMFFMQELKEILTKSLKTKIGASLIYSDLKGLKQKLDASEIGGTPFLGITKPVIKAHGSSKARAIRSAIRQAIELSTSGVIADIAEHVDDMSVS